MEMSDREIWTVIHGMGLGAIYLLAFGGALAGMWSFRPGFLTAAAVRERMTRLYVGFGAMCVTAWATVITGTYIVYPWYRVKLAGAEFESARAWTCRRQNVHLVTSCCPVRVARRRSGTTSAWSGKNTWPGSRRCWRPGS